MSRRPLAAAAGAVLAASLSAAPVFGQSEAPQEPPKLKFYADVRLRSESDRDSMQSDGIERADRDRLRFRFRLGFNYAYNPHLTFGARVRSGNPQDQQSPHQTFGDEFESKSFNIDRAFVLGSWDRAWVWGGKNSFPFWMQNELFWDEDVNPEGAAAGFTVPLAQRVRLRPTVAYFILEPSASSNRYGDKSHMAGAQLALEAGFEPVDVTWAAGFYSFSDNAATTDVALDDLDYSIWVGSIRAAFKTAMPWSVGVDYMNNTEDYPATLFNADEKTGYVFSLNVGRLKERHDWLIGYYFAHIEKYAVVARLAQDDYLRWGSGSDTRSSNFEGHEIRLAYALGPSWNIMLRLYKADAIELESPAAVALEDGKRARLDFNISF